MVVCEYFCPIVMVVCECLCPYEMVMYELHRHRLECDHGGVLVNPPSKQVQHYQVQRLWCLKLIAHRRVGQKGEEVDSCLHLQQLLISHF